MAFGEHWEWRGFGTPTADALRRIAVLPLRFPDAQDVTDHYLWVPGSAINVKLRFRDLKFKRLLGISGPFERWLEDEAESHPFPLSRETVGKLARALGLTPGRLPESVEGPAELTDLLRRTAPDVRLVSVKKLRWQRDWCPRGAVCDEPVIVELAAISIPETISSIALEHPRLEDLVAAHDALGVADGLRRISYLDAVATWGSGARLASP